MINAAAPAMKIEITIFLFVLLLARVAIAIKYRSNLVSQRVVHFENPYVDFDAKFYGDEGYPYMTVKQIISPYNDLHLMLYARVYDQPPTFLANAPLSLCKLLYDEYFKKNATLMQFGIPKIYNLNGKQCPIEQGRIRLTPYAFPSEFETDVNLGCGFMNIESRLLKCGNDDEDEDSKMQSRSCVTLMKTVTDAFVLGEYCATDNQTAKLIEPAVSSE